MRKITLLLFLFVGTLCSHAQVSVTDISTWANAVYVEPTTVQSGTTCHMYVKLRSEIESSGLQADFVFPDGIKVTNVEEYITTDLVCSGNYLTDGSYRVLYCVSGLSIYTHPADFDAEVLRLTLEVDADVAEGEYPITISDIIIPSSTGVAGTDRKPEDIVCKLTVTKESVYADGYAVTVPAMQVKPGMEYDSTSPDAATWMIFSKKNMEKTTKVAYKIALPANVSIGTYAVTTTRPPSTTYYPDGYYMSSDTDYPVITDNADGTYSIEGALPLSPGTADYIKIPLVSDATLTDGVYDITISDIKFTTQKEGYEERIYEAAPYTVSLVVVSGKTNVIDVTSAKGLDNLSIDVTENPNMLIKATAGQIANLQNVVIDGVCDNLVLTDGYPFVAPVDFVAATASYSRSSANRWGTLCLPYAVSSGDGVQYYTLSEVDIDAEGKGYMSLSEVAEVPANEPAIFCLDEDIEMVAAKADNVDIAAASDVVREVNPIDGWSLIGCFEHTTVKATDMPNSFYIKDNKFWKVNDHFNIAPFRAYFNSVSVDAAKVASFDLTTEIVDGIDSVINESMSVGEVYDLNGRKMDSGKLAPGVYIVNKKKVVIL